MVQYNAMQGLQAFGAGRQMGTEMRVGNALAEGNMQGAQQAAFRGGDVNTGLALRQQGQQEQASIRDQMAQMNERQRAEAMQRAEGVARLGMNLMDRPYEQRVQILQSPMFAQQAQATGIDPNGLSGFDPTDENILAAAAPVIELARGGGEVPASVRALQMRAEAGGLQPGTPQYREFMIQGGGRREPMVQVNTGNQPDPRPQIGTPPAGYQAIFDAQANGYRMERIPGGPAEADQRATQDAQAVSSDLQRQGANIVLENIGDAQAILTGNPGAGGRAGAVMQFDPESDTASLRRTYATLNANLAFDRLQAMREASPTGGALGAVSEVELELLRSAVANLDPTAPADEQIRNLGRVQERYSDIVKGNVQHRSRMLGYDLSDVEYTAQQENMTLHEVLDQLEG